MAILQNPPIVNGINSVRVHIFFDPDLRVHLNDGGDHLHAHLCPLHDAGVGRGDRRRPL